MISLLGYLVLLALLLMGARVALNLPSRRTLARSLVAGALGTFPGLLAGNLAMLVMGAALLVLSRVLQHPERLQAGLAISGFSLIMVGPVIGTIAGVIGGFVVGIITLRRKRRLPVKEVMWTTGCLLLLGASYPAIVTGNRHFNARANAEMRSQLVPVILGIDRFAATRHRTPRSLTELVPSILTGIPVTRKPFEYRIHGKYWLISFEDEIAYIPLSVPRELLGLPTSGQFDVYWSKSGIWTVSDFTEWPTE